MCIFPIFFPLKMSLSKMPLNQKVKQRLKVGQIRPDTDGGTPDKAGRCLREKITLRLARISHEHCVNLEEMYKIHEILRKLIYYQIYTMFTKGQSMRRHLLQSLAVNIVYYSSLPKTSNLTPSELMRNAG
jgi:hypothetical protein